MSDAATRARRFFAMIAAGTLLIAAGIVIDRTLLGAGVGEGPPVEASSDEPGRSSEDHVDDDSHDEESPAADDPSSEPDVTSQIELSAAILDNIGLTTQVVDFGPVEETLRFPGTVRMHPDGVAILSTRIQGKVLSVSVAPGDRVRRGQVLALIQSLVPGNPPPTVELVAPITGIVARRDAVLGQAVQPNDELFQLIDPRRVVAEARVPERVVDRIRLGQEARVHRLRDHERSTGRVTFIGSDAAPVTRTYPVWIELSLGTQSTPRPGQFMDILLIESRRTALTVPQQSITEEGPLRYVFVQRGHVFERRLVQTGAEDEDNIEILSGVAAGDTVAVAGSYELLLALQAGGPGSLTDESAPHEH